MAKGPIRFKILVQVAAPRTQPTTPRCIGRKAASWRSSEPSSSPARLGDNAAEQKQIIFDPIPRVDGIDPSADPLLELRAAIYLLSGRRRRAAKPEEMEH